MADFTQTMLDVAQKLVDQFGQDMIVRKYTDGTEPDPTKPWKPGAATVNEQTTRGVLVDFRPDQVEGYAYQRGDKIIYIAAKGLTGPITEQDIIMDSSGVEWAIISAARVYPAGTDLLFQLYVREWPRRLK